MRWVNRYSLLSGILVWLAAALAVAWGQDNNSKSKTQDNADERVESRPAAVPSLEALTKLRRSQKKPDPVTIEVELPKNSHATTRDLPKFRVALKNVDVEKLAVKFKYDGDYRSGRLARWRFEVRDSNGKLLPPCHWNSSIGGGMFWKEELAYGGVWKAELPLRNYVNITSPGEYTIRVLYHDEKTIAERENVDGLIVCSSKSFKLKVGKPIPKVIQVSPGSRERAKELIAALADNGAIHVVLDKYGPRFYKFIDPKSPEGQLHAMGWDAMPGLLDALRNEKLSFHRRGWVLAMLYAIAQERDLDPFVPDERADGVLPDYAYRGLGCEGTCSGSEPNLSNQREFASEWLKLAAECWQFREKER